MPATIKRLTRQGLFDLEINANSLQDAARHEPREGVYTVSNTYKLTQTLLLDAHLDRLEDSARRERIPLAYDRSQLKAALRALILEADYGDVRFRISAAAEAPEELILSIEPYQPPSPSLIANGARCQTSTAIRKNPASKSSGWMHRRRALEAAKPAGIYEVFLLDSQGNLLEGASSNVYVLLDGALHTAGSGVLAGISRLILREVCGGIVPLRMEAANMADADHFSEMFLSSSSRGIIPVVELDRIVIGDGRVGPTTLALREAYQQWVEAHLEEL
ncbi:MAG: aminotransferase class IV [Chloroflexota bacterium]|nr:aminotransferase class IV [Chloroflexota bacterium]